jgi:hypothetical protein
LRNIWQGWEWILTGCCFSIDGRGVADREAFAGGGTRSIAANCQSSSEALSDFVAGGGGLADGGVWVGDRGFFWLFGLVGGLVWVVGAGLSALQSGGVGVSRQTVAEE